MDLKEIVKLAYQVFSNKKGEGIKIIDTQSVSVLVDCFIIADGSNPNQMQTTTDNVEEILEKADCECKQIEGYQNVNWIPTGYKDVTVHIFCREDRLSYDLE